MEKWRVSAFSGPNSEIRKIGQMRLAVALTSRPRGQALTIALPVELQKIPRNGAYSDFLVKL